MPTPSTIADVAAASAGGKSDKARDRALRQAKADAKALWDCLKSATERDQDGDVRDALVAAARTRLALVTKALEQA